MIREYTTESGKSLKGAGYWIVIDSTRRLLLNKYGQWVNLYSVDADSARYETREQAEAAINMLPLDERQF